MLVCEISMVGSYMAWLASWVTNFTYNLLYFTYKKLYLSSFQFF